MRVRYAPDAPHARARPSLRTDLPRVPGFGVLALALAAAVAAGATREVALRQPPFWTRDSTFIAANVGLVLIAVLQMLRGAQQRRKKFKVVREAAEQAPAPAAPPSPAAAAPVQRAPPAPSPPRASPSTPAAASTIVRCGQCAQPLKIAPTPRPLRFKCPKCQTVGVAN